MRESIEAGTTVEEWVSSVPNAALSAAAIRDMRDKGILWFDAGTTLEELKRNLLAEADSYSKNLIVAALQAVPTTFRGQPRFELDRASNPNSMASVVLGEEFIEAVEASRTAIKVRDNRERAFKRVLGVDLSHINVVDIVDRYVWERVVARSPGITFLLTQLSGLGVPRVRIHGAMTNGCLAQNQSGKSVEEFAQTLLAGFKDKYALANARPTKWKLICYSDNTPSPDRLQPSLRFPHDRELTLHGHNGARYSISLGKGVETFDKQQFIDVPHVAQLAVDHHLSRQSHLSRLAVLARIDA